MNGFDHLNTPGCPSLPVKNLLLALPPQATLISVELQIGGTVQLPGVYQILPAPIPIPYTNSDMGQNPTEKNLDCYNSNNAYPSDPLTIQGRGSLRQYQYVSISICPFIYYPLSGELFYSTNAEITLHYIPDNPPEDQQLTGESNADLLAKTMFMNYDQIKQYYHPIESVPQIMSDDVEYVIITTDDLVDAVTQSNFIVWKNALGYNFKIVTTTDPDIADQHGQDLAEKIRTLPSIILP